jgi:pimeloyl-ACP methyl ester carboxylesterase
VDSIEKWRAAVGLERLIVVSHSFGGYLATAYALKYPEHVEHLFLIDSWGFEEGHTNCNDLSRSIDLRQTPTACSRLEY